MKWLDINSILIFMNTGRMSDVAINRKYSLSALLFQSRFAIVVFSHDIVAKKMHKKEGTLIKRKPLIQDWKAVNMYGQMQQIWKTTATDFSSKCSIFPLKFDNSSHFSYLTLLIWTGVNESTRTCDDPNWHHFQLLSQANVTSLSSSKYFFFANLAIMIKRSALSY